MPSPNTETTFHPCTGEWGTDNTPKSRILVIYTGGTIGAVHIDPNDPDSPLGIAKWDELSSNVPKLEDIRKKEKIRIDAESFKEPIDSANMVPAYWSKLVELIVKYGSISFFGQLI